MDELRIKKQEIARIEAVLYKESQTLALDTARKAVSGGNLKLINAAIDNFFTNRVLSVEFTTADTFNRIVSSNLQGGRQGSGIMATITIKGGSELQWQYTKMRISNIILIRHDKTKEFIQGAFAFVDTDIDSKFIDESANHILLSLLGKEYANHLESNTVQFFGIFLGTLQAFLATYAESISKKLTCDNDKWTPHPSNLSEIWGNIFKM